MPAYVSGFWIHNIVVIGKNPDWEINLKLTTVDIAAATFAEGKNMFIKE
jgi:hypothetical protein